MDSKRVWGHGPLGVRVLHVQRRHLDTPSAGLQGSELLRLGCLRRCQSRPGMDPSGWLGGCVGAMAEHWAVRSQPLAFIAVHVVKHGTAIEPVYTGRFSPLQIAPITCAVYPERSNSTAIRPDIPCSLKLRHSVRTGDKRQQHRLVALSRSALSQFSRRPCASPSVSTHDTSAHMQTFN